MLPRKLAQNAVLLQRFLKEAQSAENLDHPNIVAIYDRGFDQGRHYLVLEFVEGRDLYDRVRLNGVLQSEEAVKFIREVALGLQYAAGLGMIHRDVKPANLLLTPDGQAKIIDLGLALQAADEDERVTRDGTTVGTVDYMSPEQARDSRKITERSDIYSLGCTFHYLLTGSAPFPGGSLADKLARHHSAPAPDVRDRNPQVPADLALLIQKMMAKKPEQRFKDYAELIQALDRIGAADPGIAPALISDVLIDESDDDDDSVELTIAVDPPVGSTKSSHRLTSPRSATETSPPASTRELSLADLAALDSDEPSASGKRRGAKPSVPSTSYSLPLAEPILDDEDDDSDEPVIGRAGGELPLQTWIAAGVMVGLVIAVVAFGVRFALSLLKTDPESTVTSVEGSLPEPIGVEESAIPSVGPTVPTAGVVKPGLLTKPGSKSLETTKASGTSKANSTTSAATRAITEVSFSPDLMSRLGISNRSARPTLEPSGKVIVRRLAEPGDPSQTSSLASALGRLTDEVEIADVGPFQEDDYQIAGKSRLIRGRAGTRPILKIEFTRQALVRDQEAKFMLGLNGVEQLTIEGIDLVVDVRDLPLTQATLFLCQGVDLTLRDCSITIANAEDRKSGFSIFRLVQGPRPNRLWLDRCLIRGPIQTLAQVVSNRSEIAIDRSVIVGSSGPLIQFEPSERSERLVQCYRSVLATRGSVFAWNGRPGDTTIRSLGATFARVEPVSASPPVAPAPWMTARGASATDLKNWLDYDGEANRWVGWVQLAQWGGESGPPGRVSDDLRTLWPSSDQTSRDVSTPWSASLIEEKVTAATYSAILPELSATLKQVASPHPALLELTVDLFPRLPAPELLDDFSYEVAGPNPRTTLFLSFDASLGITADFGQFLKDQVTDGSKRYVVRVSGTGTHPMTPVKLPNGVSVAILGPHGEGTANPIPIFFASKTSLALIELHQGDLAIANVGFATDGIVRTRHWLLVEDGLLALRRTRYRDVGPSDPTVGAAIAFQSPATQPIPTRSGGFNQGTSRPIASLKDCWIGTTGDGISAELSRGIVQLENCLLQAGNAAIRLKPILTNPANFEADLILENCTVADDRFGVLLDPGEGETTMLARPWLIVSRSSVFPRNWREGGALLAADPSTFAQGALFWESSNDVYEVSRFLAPSGASATGPSGSPDLKRQWVDLWGLNHTRGDRGPDSRKLERILHFRDKDRSRTSRPSLIQMELDPKLHSKQGVSFKGLPPIPRS